MAASIAGSNSDGVARCVNSLTLMNMQNIASGDFLCEFVSDYFETRPIGNSDNDSDLTESGRDNCDVEVDGSGSVTGDSEAVDDGPAAFTEGTEHLADVILPLGGAGDGPETMPDFLVNCSCKLNEEQPCHTRYSSNELADIKLQYRGMTHDELDIAILAKLSCGMHLSSMTTQSCKGQQKERKAQQMDFYHHGFRICRDVFTFLHGIS